MEGRKPHQPFPHLACPFWPRFGSRHLPRPQARRRSQGHQVCEVSLDASGSLSVCLNLGCCLPLNQGQIARPWRGLYDLFWLATVSRFFLAGHWTCGLLHKKLVDLLWICLAAPLASPQRTATHTLLVWLLGGPLSKTGSWAHLSNTTGFT